VRSVLEGRHSKKLANRVAGYLTTLAKRAARREQAEGEEGVVEEAQSSPAG